MGIESIEQIERGSQDSLLVLIAEIFHFVLNEKSTFTGEVVGEGAEFDLLREAYALIKRAVSPAYLSMTLDYNIAKIIKDTPGLSDEVLLRMLLIKHLSKTMANNNWDDFMDISRYICSPEARREIETSINKTTNA